MRLLEVSQLSKQFKSHHAVKNMSFSIEEGRCIALLGPNGAGKTTTIKMLVGLLQPTGGQIKLYHNGQAVPDVRPYIGYLPQMPVFYNWMTGREFVRYAGELAGLPGKEAASLTEEWLEIVGLKDAAKRRIGGYSGGMKQRLGFAQALIHRPKLLVLDEPVSALDPIGRREVLNLLNRIRQQTTILFSTHVLHDAEEVCDDVLIIRGGEIAVQGSLHEVRQSYSEPTITVQVDPDGDVAAREWLRSLTGKSYVEQSELLSDTVILTVSDTERAQQDILSETLRQHISLRRFEAGRTTLEDLFLKVVQS